MILFSKIILAQDCQQNEIFADSCFVASNYKLAAKEYLRCVFICKSSDYKLYAKVANSFAKYEDFLRAADYFEMASAKSENDSLQIDFRIKKAECYLLANQLHYAIIETKGLKNIGFPNLEAKRNTIIALNYWKTEKYGTSLKYFLKADNNKNTEEITMIFYNPKNFVRPSPFLAFVYGFLLPGAGEIYAGETRSGLKTSALSAGIFLGGYQITKAVSFGSAVSVAAPWLLLFQWQGIGNAMSHAIELQKSRRKATKAKLLKIVNWHSFMETKKRAIIK